MLLIRDGTSRQFGTFEAGFATDARTFNIIFLSRTIDI
jgi:hypothetical protein